mgnify:CR=1 FL=1
MKKLFYIFIIFVFFQKAFSSYENITNIRYYKNQICSYNGLPTVLENNTVKCECKPEYVTEPKEEKKIKIHNQTIQCSYRRKKRFQTFFLAAICPFGADYFYLGHYTYGLLAALINFIIIALNCISMVLNYQLEKKNEEAKRQLKLKKNTNKFDIRNLAELNDRCVKSFNLAAKILIFFTMLFWLGNAIIQGLGIIPDSNGVSTEDDMKYIFQTADDK